MSMVSWPLFLCTLATASASQRDARELLLRRESGLEASSDREDSELASGLGRISVHVSARGVVDQAPAGRPLPTPEAPSGTTARHSEAEGSVEALQKADTPARPSAAFGLLFLLSLMLALAAVCEVHRRSLLRTSDCSDRFADSQLEGKSSMVTDTDALLGLRLLATVLCMMALSRFLVRSLLRLDHGDQGYSLHLFLRQDFHKVVLDLFFLFALGRMSSPASMRADSWAFTAIVFIGSLIPTAVDQFDFMQHSVSFYSMRCQWTAMTWTAVSLIVTLVLPLVGLHVHFFCVRADSSERIRLLAQMAFMVTVFVLPRAFEPGFHMHHWYTMWLLAHVCCFPTSWSRGCQAFLLGGYINGVAMFGRDPVLMCQAAFDLASNQRCPFFVNCISPESGGQPAPARFTAPNPYTCEAGDYALLQSS